MLAFWRRFSSHHWSRCPAMNDGSERKHCSSSPGGTARTGIVVRKAISASRIPFVKTNRIGNFSFCPATAPRAVTSPGHLSLPRRANLRVPTKFLASTDALRCKVGRPPVWEAICAPRGLATPPRLDYGASALLGLCGWINRLDKQAIVASVNG